MLNYTENIAQMLDTSTTNVKIVDDYGNIWDCDLIFGTVPYEHCRVGNGKGLWRLAGCVKVSKSDWELKRLQ